MLMYVMLSRNIGTRKHIWMQFLIVMAPKIVK